jgi:hypothetical protein
MKRLPVLNAETVEFGPFALDACVQLVKSFSCWLLFSMPRKPMAD